MKPSNKGLLTTKEKERVFADYPCLDPSFEDDYQIEVATLLQAQRDKTIRQILKNLQGLSPLCPNRSLCLDKFNKMAV